MSTDCRKQSMHVLTRISLRHQRSQRDTVHDSRMRVDQDRHPPRPARTGILPSMHSAALNDNITGILEERFGTVLHLQDQPAGDY